MKAVSCAAPRQVEIIDVSPPQPGPEDVLVEVRYVGLCGSDLNAYRGGFALMSYPRILGHEVSGVVAAVGEKVPPTIRAGDQVTLSPYSNCGVCPACRAGRPNCCQYNETLGLQRDGALRPQFAIHYSKVYTSRKLSLKGLALVEPLSVGYHTANRGRVSEMDTVLVLGCGTIGLGAVATAVRKGAEVMVVDIDDDKLAAARRFGAHHTVNSARQSVLEAVADLTGGEGVSVAIEAIGLPETYRLAIEAVAFAGRVVYVGYAKKEVCYDTTPFVRKELDILGARNALREFPAVIKMIEQNEELFLSLISRVYPFEQTATALADWDAEPAKFAKILIEVA